MNNKDIHFYYSYKTFSKGSTVFQFYKLSFDTKIINIEPIDNDTTIGRNLF